MVPFSYASAPSLLHDGVRVLDIADRCRSAALLFMNGGAQHWNKADLAGWLVGQYRSCTRTGGTTPPPAALRPTRRPVEPAMVDDLLTDAHLRVLTVLENAAISREPTEFAKKISAEHAMQRVTDRYGVHGWMPVNTPRMRLAYRVLTLFAADALTRPHDYNGLTVCHLCEHVRFRGIDPTCVCAE